MPSRYPPDRSGRLSNEASNPDIPQHALINIIRIPVNVQVSPIELIVRRIGTHHHGGIGCLYGERWLLRETIIY